MNLYRYILEPYKGKASRHTCPSCQKQRTFARYFDTETGGYIADHVGRCNREDNCGYHYKLKQHFEDNPDSNAQTHFQPIKLKPKAPPKPASVISPEIFKGSLSGYSSNRLAIYLESLFGADTASQAISRYLIGTSKFWEGATVFWQVDGTGKVRAGKIMLYSPSTGKRSKGKGTQPTWVHTALNLPDFNLKQCFFGEHLLQRYPGTPVAIVESEKTAIIASVYLPQFIWLATGGKGGLNAEKCQALKGRRVVLFPDLNAYDKWSEKAAELSPIASFTVSSLLERKATPEEKEQGLDLADYLVKTKYEHLLIPAAIQADPLPLYNKEFYHLSFEELTDYLGYDKAVEKVKYYQRLSEKYSSCKTFVVHHTANC